MLGHGLESVNGSGGQGGASFFDQVGRGTRVGALGELARGEELGVAAGAVTGAEEVDEALLADGNVSGCGGCFALPDDRSGKRVLRPVPDDR